MLANYDSESSGEEPQPAQDGSDSERSETFMQALIAAGAAAPKEMPGVVAEEESAVVFDADSDGEGHVPQETAELEDEGSDEPLAPIPSEDDEEEEEEEDDGAAVNKRALPSASHAFRTVDQKELIKYRRFKGAFEVKSFKKQPVMRSLDDEKKAKGHKKAAPGSISAAPMAAGWRMVRDEDEEVGASTLEARAFLLGPDHTKEQAADAEMEARKKKAVEAIGVKGEVQAPEEVNVKKRGKAIKNEASGAGRASGKKLRTGHILNLASEELERQKKDSARLKTFDTKLVV